MEQNKTVYDDLQGRVASLADECEEVCSQCIDQIVKHVISDKSIDAIGDDILKVHMITLMVLKYIEIKKDGGEKAMFDQLGSCCCILPGAEIKYTNTEGENEKE